MILLTRSMQDIFLKSPKDSGELVFGIIVTYSVFQVSGQTPEAATSE